MIAATGSYDRAFWFAGLLLLIGATVALTMTRSPMVIKRKAVNTRVVA
ncbi:hypothetical protein [Caballeronia terrestris]|nr:hypothetical protein [Caballeronia terrestris]